MRSLIAATFWLGFVSPAFAVDPDVQKILDKAIEAHGGKEKLDKFRAIQAKTKGKLELMGGLDFTQEVFAYDGKFKEIMHLDAMGQKVTVTTVFNGKDAWINLNGTEIPTNDKIMEALKEASYGASLRLTKLGGKDFQVTALGESKVESKPVVGIKISSKGHKDVNMYFYKDTGLTAKVEKRTVDPMSGQELDEERLVLEYQDTDGMKTAKKVVVNRDGKKFIALEVLETKLAEKFDASEFAKP
jgi:hypothetical protein